MYDDGYTMATLGETWSRHSVSGAFCSDLEEETGMRRNMGKGKACMRREHQKVAKLMVDRSRKVREWGLARAKQRLCAIGVGLVDEEVGSLICRAIHVVDPILLQRPREAVH